MAPADTDAATERNHDSTISPVAATPVTAGVAALFAGMLLMLSVAMPVHAGTLPELAAKPVIATLARTGCDAIAARVDATPGNVPVLLRSYDSRRGHGAPTLPPLHSAAFTYDNALAVIALLACHRQPQAERIGEALRLAASNDTRLRDTYRAGPVTGSKPLPNGWWDAKRQRRVDAAHEYAGAYQDGSSCGNIAWAALALLALHRATGNPRWLAAAVHLADWVVIHASDTRGAGGFDGGVESFLLVPRRATWKSTEHNIDLVALFTWLADVTAPGNDWASQAAHARDFVASQWDAGSGHFWIGTGSDGVTPRRAPSALDVQLWAQLLPNPPKAWQRALTWVERRHAVAGGFAFTDARDGMWTEGTAQAALVYRRSGNLAEANRLLASIASQAARSGYLYATPKPRIAALYSHYHHRPCLAATAWAVIAATDRNPYQPNVTTPR